ncbi:MAG: hypothetical protein H0S82_02265, partial [Anaerolineaceae bacterium]|nr:hypothetical protein [Anaerolineaceae bacterium]
GELLLGAYFETSIPKKLDGKVNKLRRIIENSTELSTQQIEYLQSILQLSVSVEEIKEWRDHDVHMISETIQGVFSRDEESESLFTLWKKINELHNLTKEAIFMCIGFLTSIGKAVPHPFLFISGFVEDKLKKYNPSDEIETEQLEELKLLAEKRLLTEKEQRFREILFNIWRLEISSSNINLTYDE